MSKTILNLNDGWEFTWTNYCGKDRGILREQENWVRKWLPATVPGNVQSDLEKAGLVEDPFFADNADHLRWCEEVDFWYRRSIGPVDVPHGARAILHFDGLDCFATIWIEHYGSDKQCWGLLLWNLCDCWPQVSDAVISYDLEKKPAYFAIKDAYGKLNR